MFLEPWATNRENPYYRSNPDPGFEVKNFEWLNFPVTVTDARPGVNKFSLDTHGFAFRSDPLGGTLDILDTIRANNDDRVREIYYPHVERIIKEATGAAEVLVFNHTVRRRNPSLGLFEGSKGHQQPASTVHCDQTAAGAARRVETLLGDRAEKLLKGRCQIINVWRPLRGPVQDWPLALMDGQSIEDKDGHPTDLWKGQFEVLGQTMNITHAEGQRWYYLRHHRTDEVTLIKIWDNDRNVAASFCPHSAFHDPSTPEDAPLRESIEARCLVFH